MRPPIVTVAAIVAAAALAAGCGESQPRPPARESDVSADTPAASDVEKGAARDAAEFWTAERMREATPLPVEPAPSGRERPAAPAAPQADAGPPVEVAGERPSGVEVASARPRPAPGSRPSRRFPYRKFYWGGDPTALPASAVGRLFIKRGGEGFSCSGSVVNATNRSLVWTAGHCLYDPETRRYSSLVVFVPGYKDRTAPFGLWTARTLVVLAGYQEGDSGYDVGAVVLERRDGRTVQDAVGAQGIRFRPAGRPFVDAFGYPGKGQYDGRFLVVCEGHVSDKYRPASVAVAMSGLGCDMTTGASGGPWITELRPGRGWGYVVTVTSTLWSKRPGAMYGPYHGTGALNLYEYAERR